MSTFVRDNYCGYTSGDPTRPECGQLWKFYLSQGNSDPTAPNDLIERSLFVISFACMVLVRIFYQYRFQSLEKKLDKQNVDITDYTVMVFNLPLDTQEFMVKDLIRNLFRKNKDGIDECIEVSKINFVFQNYGKTIEMGNELKKQLDTYKTQLKGVTPESTEYVEMICDYNTNLENLKKNLDLHYDMQNFNRIDKKNFSGIAFVTVEKEEHADRLKKEYSLKDFPKTVYNLLGYIPSPILKCLPKKQKHYYDEIHPERGYVFIGTPKPPEDLIWENLGKGSMNNLTRKSISLLGTILIFGITLAILVSLKVWQTNAGSNFWISFAFTLVIKIINEIAGFFSKKFIDFERFSSRTMINAETTWRSTLVVLASRSSLSSTPRSCWSYSTSWSGNQNLEKDFGPTRGWLMIFGFFRSWLLLI